MTIAEAERRLKIEREILRLIEELGKDDVTIFNRIAFQMARIGDLQDFITTNKPQQPCPP